MKTYLIVFGLFIVAVLGGFTYLGYKDVPVSQTTKTVDLPMPTDANAIRP